MKIYLEHQALDNLYRWLAEHYPEEACGFLAGHESHGERRITASWPATNISTGNRGRRFVVDPVDYLRVEKRAQREGLSLLGIYHSHPDHPAIPSEHDLAAAHPFFSYVIVSLTEGQIADTRSYQLVNEAFVEEELFIPETINK